MKKIYICIPTLNRTVILGPCLESIAKIETPPDSQISVLLIDNDSEQTAKPVFDSQQNFPFPFFYYCQPCLGVSRARNVGIEKMLAANGDMILFVDDDMRLPPEYLRILVAEMQKRNADAIRGKMKVVSEDEQVRPSRRASLFSRRDTLPSNGVLVAAKIFKDYNLCFDERFMFGFEDGDFFYRAHLRGARLFLLEYPYFSEFRPDSREIAEEDKLEYFMAMRQSHVAIRKYRGGWHRGVAYVLRRGIPLILQIIANLILLLFSPRKRAKKIQRISYQLAGLVKGLWHFNIRLESPNKYGETKIFKDPWAGIDRDCYKYKIYKCGERDPVAESQHEYDNKPSVIAALILAIPISKMQEKDEIKLNIDNCDCDDGGGFNINSQCVKKFRRTLEQLYQNWPQCMTLEKLLEIFIRIFLEQPKKQYTVQSLVQFLEKCLEDENFRKKMEEKVKKKIAEEVAAEEAKKKRTRKFVQDILGG